MENTINRGGRPALANRKSMETIRMHESAWDKVKATHPGTWRSTCGQWLETLVENGGPDGLGLPTELNDKLTHKAKLVGMTREELISRLVDSFDTTAIEEATRRAVENVLTAKSVPVLPTQAIPNPLAAQAPAQSQVPTAAQTTGPVDFSRFFPTAPQAPLPSFPEPLPPVTIGFGPGKAGA